MRVAVINSFGFESGGMTTLCLYYSKLGIPVYIKNIVRPLKYKLQDKDINIYTSDEELFNISSEYDRLIFLPPAYKSDFKTGKYEKAFLPIFSIRKNNPNIQLCYLYCSRDSKDFIDYLLPTLTKNNFEFDYYFSISTELKGLKPNIICFDINAFCFHDNEKTPFSLRNKIVLTAGRVEGFKGTLKYFNNIILSSNFAYVHEGAGFTFNQNNVSVPPQLLQMKNNKTVVFKKYSDTPEFNKLNIYPTYKLEDIYIRWPTYFVGICCIMGTEHKYKKSSNLLGLDSWQVMDNRESTTVKRQSNLWGVNGLEYANLEMIDLRLPVMFSRGYSELLHFDDSRLIYDSFSEIPEKLKLLEEESYYTDCLNYQYAFFKNRQSNINKNIIDIFTKEII